MPPIGNLLKPRNSITAAIVLLIAFNGAIFLYANTRPIAWEHDEITYHHFFWSKDDVNPLSPPYLHTGLTLRDLLKPLAHSETEGVFRTRQFSSFMEMLSFKFWQFFEVASFRNFTLIGLHVINAVLIGILIFYITKSSAAAVLGALLVLNSGIAIATLLFPFRNAKTLAVTLFLAAWCLAAASPGRFFEASRRRWAGFFLAIVLALFTDETALFIVPILFFYLALRDGMDGVWNRRIVRSCLVVLGSCILLSVIFCRIGGHLDTVRVRMAPDSSTLWGTALRNISYLRHFSTVTDTLRAFFGHFLRHNFGYWDGSCMGTAAAAATALVFLFAVRAVRQKHTAFTDSLGLIIILILGLKAVCLPHNSGYHNIFMPHGTAFPSLLFFSYYYPYCEAVLAGLLVAFFLAKMLTRRKVFLLILFLATVINFSNAVHLRKGPADALAFHLWDDAGQQERARQILAIKSVLGAHRHQRVYISFPVDEAACLDGHDRFMGLFPQVNLYTSVIPVMYLRSFEKGRAVISLPIVKSFDAGGREGRELLSSDIFYDVVTAKVFDFRLANPSGSRGLLVPRTITEGALTVHPPPFSVERPTAVVFFIKGRARFSFAAGDALRQGAQSYGRSYQMFVLPCNWMPPEAVARATLTVYPENGDQPAYFIGPFVR